MIELKELKVGDVVSSNDGFGWTSRLLKTKSELWAFLSNVVEVGDEWQHGLHESLIPKGYAIAPIEPTDEMQNAARDWSVATLGHAVGGSGSRGCYQAMIEASPKQNPTNGR